MSIATKNALDAALKAHALDEGLIDEGELITDWVTIGASVSARVDETNYWRVYSGGQNASYITFGLIEIARVFETNWLLGKDPND